ncbi:MAG: hypothetical protein IKE14_00195 [Loktanella sp.]|nr:hypothetical protein [Loktanella sp.]
MSGMAIERSQSVVYSFQGRWEEALRMQQVLVFFRKKRPTKCPSRVFFYIGVPVKAIIGFAEVQEIRRITLGEANAIRNEAAISERELEKYIGKSGVVHAIRIGRARFFREPMKLSALTEEFGFNPPQSFSIMDEEVEASILDKVE